MPERPGDLLLRLCPNAKNLVIVSPYIKANALAKILNSAKHICSLTCITRWTPNDLAGGASDIECRSMIIEKGGSFRLHPFLHAKYYAVDDSIFVGSANLTLSGMGWSAQPNLEILCEIHNNFDAHHFLAEVLENAREVKDVEFSYWESIATIKTQRSPNFRDQARLSNWRPMTRDPRNLELTYREQHSEIASPDEQKATLQDIQELSIPPNLDGKNLRTWMLTCLLATPFTNSVIELNNLDAPRPVRILAETYKLDITEARRYMEAVQSWLSFLAPKILSKEYGYRHQ